MRTNKVNPKKKKRAVDEESSESSSVEKYTEVHISQYSYFWFDSQGYKLSSEYSESVSSEEQGAMPEQQESQSTCCCGLWKRGSKP